MVVSYEATEVSSPNSETHRRESSMCSESRLPFLRLDKHWGPGWLRHLAAHSFFCEPPSVWNEGAQPSVKLFHLTAYEFQ